MMLETLTVYNKPFFVNELLQIVQPRMITADVFADMVKESRTYDLDTMTIATIRQIDSSGMVPNLIGLSADPQQILEAILNMGHIQLLKIAGLDPEVQQEIFDTLKGRTGTTMRALLLLDEFQREITEWLKSLRLQSEAALAFRNAVKEALKELYAHPENLNSPLFDKVIRLEDRELIYSGEPHICYPKHIYEGGVVEVWQFFFVPKLDSVQLPKPFGKQTAGDVLFHQTPSIYLRSHADEARFDPRTPSGFMGLIGKAGGALPRLIAAQVKKNQRMHEQVLREETILEALNELF